MHATPVKRKTVPFIFILFHCVCVLSILFFSLVNSKKRKEEKTIDDTEEASCTIYNKGQWERLYDLHTIQREKDIARFLGKSCKTRRSCISSKVKK